MLLVNTNVPVDVLQNDPQWADRSIGQLRAQAQLHELAINPVVYAELRCRSQPWRPCSWPARSTCNTAGVAAARPRCCLTFSSARMPPSRAGIC